MTLLMSGKVRFITVLAGLTAVSVLWLSLASCAWIIHLDEGERLSEQIRNAANQLRNSPETETVIVYRPKMGVNQHYNVGLANVRYQPKPPFAPPYPGLTVTVEKGQGGFCNAHVNSVGVPRNFDISKFGEETEIVLRKVDGEVDVVSVR